MLIYYHGVMVNRCHNQTRVVDMNASVKRCILKQGIKAVSIISISLPYQCDLTTISWLLLLRSHNILEPVGLVLSATDGREQKTSQSKALVTVRISVKEMGGGTGCVCVRAC